MIISTGKFKNLFILFTYLICCIQLPLCLLLPVGNEGTVTPVILVPGDGGSQLQAKLNKPTTVHYVCDKKTSSYFDLWLNLESMLPWLLDCWVDNMRLVYNNETRTTTNSPGVDIRIPGFGNTTTVEWLDPSKVTVGSYYSPIVEALIATGKYERGINIRGAPYDFRKAPNELRDYFQVLKKLIEETYAMNGNTAAVLVCHSLGCPSTLYLLNRQTQQWKDTYIRSLITIAAPWGGAVKALKAFASGDNLDVVLLSSLTVRKVERNNPSTAFLLPSNKFWGQNDILAYTPKRNYTTFDYHQFFQDINWMTGWEMWKDTRSLVSDLKPPGVELHCLHGTSVDTVAGFYYPTMDDFPNYSPEIVHGDGDGTVNSRSLRGCLSWRNQQKVYHKEFQNVNHLRILSYPPLVDYVLKVVTAK